MKCQLDCDEPKLSKMGSVPEPAIREGLRKLRDKVANNHNASNWFSYQLRGAAGGEFANKVWEWDFKPTGDKSSTRPGWRVFAFVPNPNGPEPILARPFLCWDKSKAPKGNEIPTIIAALRKFLTEHPPIVTEEETFRRSQDGDLHVAVCIKCCEPFTAKSADELDIWTDTHKMDCPGKPPW